MGQTFPCPECEYQANQKSNLIRHKKLVHIIQTLPNQTVKATKKNSYARHIKLGHIGPKLHCPQCKDQGSYKTCIPSQTTPTSSSLPLSDSPSQLSTTSKKRKRKLFTETAGPQEIQVKMLNLSVHLRRTFFQSMQNNKKQLQ